MTNVIRWTLWLIHLSNPNTNQPSTLLSLSLTHPHTELVCASITPGTIDSTNPKTFLISGPGPIIKDASWGYTLINPTSATFPESINRRCRIDLKKYVRPLKPGIYRTCITSINPSVGMDTHCRTFVRDSR